MLAALVLSAAVIPARAGQSPERTPLPEEVPVPGAGVTSIRAIRLAAPLRLDGRLDEAVYQDVEPASDFIQQEPEEGSPATEKTEVWVLFDGENVYVSARNWDSHPERMIANEMRKDGSRVPRNENFAFTLDTFRDRRNGYDFEVTPVGGRLDSELANEGQTSNRDWNPVWEVRTARIADGWTLEARIPFKSLRYGSGAVQEWGFQVRRMVRWKNEISYLTRVPASVGERGHFRVSLSAALVGLEVPPAGRNLEIKPYAISTLTTDRTVTPNVLSDYKGDFGADLKYGLTRSLTFDATYNPDFAQVEADLQQVNLSRFSLFFPEKRDFFLENAGVFVFGNATGTDNVPALFYSRRIGLSGNESIPIIAGSRVSGRAGAYSIGALNIESNDTDSGVAKTNFTVLRVKRDILRRSSVGGIFTERSVGDGGPGRNRAYGVDGSFILTNTINVNLMLAQTRSPGRENEDRDNSAMRGQFVYEGDRYGLQVERLKVGAQFNPEIGFVRRRDINRLFGQARFSPRPKAPALRKVIRKFYYIGNLEYIESADSRLDTRIATGEFAVDFQSGDHANVKYLSTYEFLPVPLRLAQGAVAAAGAYDYGNLQVGYNFGPQRKLWAANILYETGTFYDGTRKALGVSNALISFPPHLMVEPTYTANWVHFPSGDFISHLLGPRVTYTVIPPMFVSALVQYNSQSRSVSSNLRFRWEYRPGSELFVVLNDQRDQSIGLMNRAFVVKINRLFR